MQVFVVSLRRPESRRPCQTALQPVSGFPQQVDARTEYHVVHEVVLVEPESGKQRQVSHLPFVLQVRPGNPHILFQVAAVARHDVVKSVKLIFKASRQRGRRKQQTVEVARVHGSAHGRKVVGGAVCVGVHARAVVAVAVGMLHRAVHGQLVLVFVHEYVVSQSAAVYHVSCLLGYVGFVRLQVKLVASAAEFVGGVILYAQAAELRGAVISPQSEGVHVELAQLGETVAVGVIRVAVPVSLIEGHAVGAVLGHERGVGAEILLPCLAAEV